jgi:OFA family oxalate/formate antiporter-like MFS transporter
MTQQPTNRWGVVIGAILIQLCLGAIYAWSVFTPALKAKSPGSIAAVYGPSQLGMSEEKYGEMNDALAVPLAAQKKAAAQEKGATTEAEAELAEAAKETAEAAVDAVVVAYVDAERLKKLEYGFSNAQTQAIFSAGLAAFAVIMVLAGRMMPKVGPRNLAIAGGVVLGLGYVLGGLIAGKSFVPLLICVGLIGGAGIGLAYVVPIAVGMKWFPDKKGMISGLAVAGFGFGALLWVYLAGTIGHLIANLGLSTTFMIYGVIFFLMCAIGAVWMKNPPEGYKPAGWEPPQAAAGGKPAAGSVDYPAGRMLATPQFYMIFLCFLFGASAGLMSIGLMKLFPMKAMMAGGMDWKAASAAAGTAMAVFFSLANGLGRIIWGTVSDKLGRKTSIIVMLATQGVLVIAFQWMAGTPGLLYLGAALIGFNFGGNFALFPSITADTFGTKYVGQNYGWVFLSYGVGGIFGPLLGGALGDAGNFALAFTICGVLCLVAAGIAAAITHPKPAVAGPAEPAVVTEGKAEADGALEQESQ